MRCDSVGSALAAEGSRRLPRRWARRMSPHEGVNWGPPPSRIGLRTLLAMTRQIYRRPNLESFSVPVTHPSGKPAQPPNAACRRPGRRGLRAAGILLSEFVQPIASSYGFENSFVAGSRGTRGARHRDSTSRSTVGGCIRGRDGWSLRGTRRRRWPEVLSRDLRASRVFRSPGLKIGPSVGAGSDATESRIFRHIPERR